MDGSHVKLIDAYLQVCTFQAAESKRFELSQIKFEVPRGQLVAVVGQVGSGKSALLHALLGEMTKLRGAVVLNGSVAYVSQSAFVLNATVWENITFGLEYDEERFERAVSLSCLKADIESESMPKGKDTVIGEKGLTLSGGQKQRVSIARALYRQADIYLFDDCLSALDATVGQKVFEQCIAGELCGTTRVLVTHAVQHLPQCDYVLVMEGGKIAEQGTYEEVRTAPVLSKFVDVHSASLNKMIEREDADEAQETADSAKEKMVKVTKTKKAKVDGDGAQAQKEEKRMRGSVGRKVYWSYGKACGGECLCAVKWSVSVTVVIDVVVSALMNM